MRRWGHGCGRGRLIDDGAASGSHCGGSSSSSGSWNRRHPHHLPGASASATSGTTRYQITPVPRRSHVRGQAATTRVGRSGRCVWPVASAAANPAISDTAVLRQTRGKGGWGGSLWWPPLVRAGTWRSRHAPEVSQPLAFVGPDSLDSRLSPPAAASAMSISSATVNVVAGENAARASGWGGGSVAVAPLVIIDHRAQHKTRRAW